MQYLSPQQKSTNFLNCLKLNKMYFGYCRHLRKHYIAFLRK